MDIHVINPLSDNRWDDLVARHPRASVFHERGWLDALNRTYGYEPFVLTSTPTGQQLRNGLVLCRVSSWITGTRSVSLPFTDHCDPLLNGPGDLPEFAKWLRASRDRQAWKYVELRPMTGGEESGFSLDRAYFLHTLDLRPPLEQIFGGLHKDSIQRRIRRAEKEALSYENGHSDQLVREFYSMLVMTRKRHQVPPPPLAWFRNLVECLGEQVQIRLARKNGLPIAGLLTLRHRSSVVYKYGGSDERFHPLGGMPFLFWKLIEESKASGAEEIDFGRTDLDHEGLIIFKDRLGTTKRLLSYYRYPQTEKSGVAAGWSLRAMGPVFSVLPDSVLPTIGRVLYRHMG